MANPEHLKILKQGVEVWNRWKRQLGSMESPNLSGVIIKNAFLREIDFEDTDLSRANLSGSHFNYASFSHAKLKGAIFQGSNLIGANFIGVELKDVDFTDSLLEDAIFGLTEFSNCKGLETVKVHGPCIIDFHTLRASRNLPKSFLLKIGLPENYINYLPDFFDENPIRMYPVFLSHSWQNKEFANKLYNALIDRGVQVWYDEKKMKPGDDIYESISRGIDVYDKMILVCSKESLSESWWVDREMGRILEKERKLLQEKGKKVKLLIPIKIDDHVHDWDGGKKTEILDLKIGDFRHWQDETKFQKSLDELIAALNVDRGEAAPPSFL